MLYLISEIVKKPLRILSREIKIWCAEQPAATLFLIILLSAILLPFITVTALTPLVAFLHFTNYVTHQGILLSTLTLKLISFESMLFNILLLLYTKIGIFCPEIKKISITGYLKLNSYSTQKTNKI